MPVTTHDTDQLAGLEAASARLTVACVLEQLQAELRASRVLLAMHQLPAELRTELNEALGLAADQLDHAHQLVLGHD